MLHAGTGAISSEEMLSVTKGFTGKLRFGRSLTEAQDLEKVGQGNQLRREENKSSQQDSNAASLGRFTGPVTEIPYNRRGHQCRVKLEEFGLGHPEFQTRAKQSKENVKQSWKSQVRNEDSKQRIHPALYLAMALPPEYISQESMVIALYETVLKNSKCSPTSTS